MPQTEPRPPKLLAEAFGHWLDAQREAIEVVDSAPHPGHPADWGEGYRWVTRIASLAQNWALEKNDPLRPEIYLSQGPARKLIVDNPDVNYYFARLDENETYRLTGNRGSALHVGLTVGTDFLRSASSREKASGPTGTVGQYNLDEFERAANGDYEILLSRARQPGNWIPLATGAAQIAVRETFGDRSRELPATYWIERVGDPAPAPELGPERCAEQLHDAADLLLFIVRTCAAMWRGNAGHLNQIGGAAGQQHVDAQDDAVRTHSATDMVYQGGRWKLAPGQALKVTISPPAGGSLYWGLTLVNPWAESYEYRYSQVCTNQALARPDADGSWTVVISAQDPGLSNWLDTGGRLEGFALIRWVWARSLPANPVCELIDL